MPLRIVILPSAKLDITKAVKWYESKQKGLGRRFKNSVIRSVDQLADPAKGYGPYVLNLSRVFVYDFPYCIYFRTDEFRKQIVVYAVLNEKQDRNEILSQRISF
jgi:plasmid stabilization system protein ParE